MLSFKSPPNFTILYTACAFCGIVQPALALSKIVSVTEAFDYLPARRLWEHFLSLGFILCALLRSLVIYRRDSPKRLLSFMVEDDQITPAISVRNLSKAFGSQKFSNDLHRLMRASSEKTS
jgi:hypothetical protein